jgi:NTP pyrophosphatase (non-canonical NTP hydrolase)
MAIYAGQGDTALTLAEECAEVIQIITKMKRFGGNWDEVPPGKDKTRWQMLEEEMNDLLCAWDTLKNEHP